MRAQRRALLICPTVIALASCGLQPTPSPATSPSPEPSTSPSPGPTETPRLSASAEPTATPEPALSLELPDETDDRIVSVNIDPQVGSEDGEIVVTVTSDADSMVTELVLRWATRLSSTLFLRPFEPSEQRIVDGGPPLVQDWTKWVVGPGEEGEPAGTTSLGWGPLMPGATLTIPIDVVRRAEGPVTFDLQILSENVDGDGRIEHAILTLPNGRPAEFRVEVP
jgi:hypothetical protein